MQDLTPRALADSEQSVFWLDSPEAPAPLPPLEGEASCELAIVGGGFTGLWAALLAAPDEDVLLLEGDRCGWGASGRNGGFLDASLTHGLENGESRWPGEMSRLVELGDENYDALRERPSTRAASMPPGRRTASSTSPRASTSSTGCAEGAELARRYGHEVELLDRAAGAREGRLAHLPRGPSHPHRRRRARGPCAARVGAARGGARGRRAHPRGHEGHVAAPRRRRRRARDGSRARARGEGRARHQRLPAAGALDRPLRDPGLRLRARERAARPGAARRDRLAGPRGTRRLGQPLPLLPAHRRRPHPLGRLRGGLPLGERHAPRARGERRRSSTCSRTTSSRRSRSSRACASRIAGRGRSTPARASA